MNVFDMNVRTRMEEIYAVVVMMMITITNILRALAVNRYFKIIEVSNKHVGVAGDEINKRTSLSGHEISRRQLQTKY